MERHRLAGWRGQHRAASDPAAATLLQRAQAVGSYGRRAGAGRPRPAARGVARSVGRRRIRRALATGADRWRRRGQGSRDREQAGSQAAELDGACAAIGVRGRLRARPIRVRRTVRQQCLAAGMSPAVLESRLGQRDRDGDRGRTPPRHPRGRRGRDRCGRTQALWPDAAREWARAGGAQAYARLWAHGRGTHRKWARRQRRRPARERLAVDYARRYPEPRRRRRPAIPGGRGTLCASRRSSEACAGARAGRFASAANPEAVLQYAAGRRRRATPTPGRWSSIPTPASAATPASSPASRRTMCPRSVPTRSAGAATCTG